MPDNDSLAYVPCMNGVKHTLFSIYLKNLGQFLMSRSVNWLSVDVGTQATLLDIVKFLYAEDTVLIGSSAKYLQYSVSVFEDYRREWQLTVNVQKQRAGCRVWLYQFLTIAYLFTFFIFSNNKHKTYNFQFGGRNLDAVDEYMFLGIYLSKRDYFKAAKPHIAKQVNKALFALLKKIKASDACRTAW